MISREMLLAKIKSDAGAYWKNNRASSSHVHDAQSFVDGATPWANLALEMAKALEEMIESNRKRFHEDVCCKSMGCHCKPYVPPALAQFQVAVKGEEK